MCFIIVISQDLTPFRGFFTQSREATTNFISSAALIGNFVNEQADWQIRPCDGTNVCIILSHVESPSCIISPMYNALNRTLYYICSKYHNLYTQYGVLIKGVPLIIILNPLPYIYVAHMPLTTQPFS